MPATLTVEGPCRRTLAFTIERARVDAAIEQGVRQAAARSSFKGFRPGKAPLDLVRKTQGARIAEDTRQRLMSEAFSEAIREHGLHPVGDPEMNLEKLSDEADGPFTFEVTVEIAPEFELHGLDDLAVTVRLPVIDEALVDREMEAFRKQAATVEDAPEDATVGRHDVLEATLLFVVDGTELPPRTDRRVIVERESVDGITVEGAAEALVGRRVGESVELEAELPDGFEPRAHAGKRATLRLTIDRHRQVIVPELDQALLERAGVSSESELRAAVRARLEQQLKRARDGEVDRQIETRLMEGHAFELPERLLARSIDRRVHEYAHRLMEQRGLGSDEGHAAAEAEREQIARLTRDGLRASFIYSKIARENGLGARRDEAEHQVRALAAVSGQDPDETLKNAYANGWIEDVLSQITEEKTRRWLRDKADVREETVAAPEEARPSGLIDV